MKTAHVSHQLASQLLHNKFVVVLGDSIHRGVYKDLVLLLQKDNYLAASQLKTKGEEQFENDELLEGGRKGQMSNGTQYKEVREFTSDHHRVRFYFVTRIYSKYMQSILEEFEKGPKPDLVIMNSCVWDVSRYGRQWEPDYMQNLTLLFGKMRAILPEEALIIWNLTMPLGKNIIGGFLVPEVAEFGPNLRFDIIEANYCSATLASVYGLDVLDLHFQFRFSLQHRMRDGVHWNAVAHRRMTSLMLAHIANAWGVELPPSQPPTGLDQSFSEQVPAKEVQQQPWKAQNSGYRCRPKEWRYNNYPVPATPWMTSNSGYRCRQKEWRYDYPVPATPWMTSNFYGGNRDQWPAPSHVRGQDFARDYVPPQAAPSYDTGFFIGYPQQDSNDYHYVMRKKHSRNAHYRPY